MIKIENTVTVITPDTGYKYVTNGDVFSDLVKLGKNDSVDNWYSTNDEPPEAVPPEGAHI